MTLFSRLENTEKEERTQNPMQFNTNQVSKRTTRKAPSRKERKSIHPEEETKNSTNSGDEMDSITSAEKQGICLPNALPERTRIRPKEDKRIQAHTVQNLPRMNRKLWNSV